MTSCNEEQADVSQAYLYVATDGDDGWQGELPAANAQSTDGPFATLARARDAIRQIKRSGQLNAPITVMVRGGMYFMDEPLALEAQDSGSPGRHVTYAGCPGESPVLSGGKRITRWQPHKGNIMRAVLPDAAAGTWKFRQLFFNGERQIRSRWPKHEPQDPLYGGWAFVDETMPHGPSNTHTLRYEPTTQPCHWSKPHLAEINIFPWYCWLNEIMPVTAIDHDSGTITFGGELLMSDLMKPLPGNRFVIENVLEELDGPGQWCLDWGTGTVYFWPPGDAIESGDVIAPAIDNLISLRGTAGQPVRFVNIQGFTFTQTLCTFPEHVHANFHSPSLRGEAIRMENAEDCCVENNLFDAVGGDGVRLQGDTARNRILNNKIVHAGAAGISIAGDGPGNPHLWSDASQLEEAAQQCPKSVNNVIMDNQIHHCGCIRRNGAAIQVYGVKSVDCVISHNWIHDTPDKGICMQDGFGRFFVEYNEIHDVALEIGDSGGIQTNRWYVLANDAELCHGSVFRYNLIRNVIGCCAYREPSTGKPATGSRAEGRIWTPYMTWGIYFDNSPMHFTVFGNIVIGAVLGGICMPVHDPKSNLFENNILVNCKVRQADLIAGRDIGGGNRFIRNILYYTDPDAALLAIGPTTTCIYDECDYNVYCAAGGQDITIQKFGHESEETPLTLSQWRELGYDEHSIVADPLFVDPGGGDYRLKPESPAFRVSFKPIDVSLIGCRSR